MRNRKPNFNVIRFAITAFLLFLYLSNIYSQNNTLDSLQKVLLSQREDTNKVNTLIRLSSSFSDIKEYKNALDNVEKAIALCEKIGFKKGLLSSYRRLGSVYLKLSNNNSTYEYYNETVDCLKKGLNLSEKLGDKRNAAYFAKFLSRIFDGKNNDPESLKYAFIALSYYEAVKDRKQVIGELNAIGHIYMYQKNYKDALPNFIEAVKNAEEINDKNGVAREYANIANTYASLNSFELAFKNLDKSFEVLKKTDKEMPKHAFGNYYFGSLGQIYIKQGDYERNNNNFEKAEKLYGEAINCFNSAEKIFVENNKRSFIQPLYLDLGYAYMRLKKNIFADSILKAAIKFLGNDTREYLSLSDGYLYLSKVDSMQGNWRDAFTHYSKHVFYKDSLFNTEITRKLTTYQMQSNFDKKEAVTKAQQAEEVAKLNALTLKAEAEQVALKQKAEIAELKRLSETGKLVQENKENEFKRQIEKQDLEQRNAQNELNRKVENQRLQQEKTTIEAQNKIKLYSFAAALGVFSLIALLLYRNNRQKQKANDLLQQQKQEIDAQKLALEKTLADLKSTQTQLIQKEKLASLGELTAGIAHEIQNPLNFVNNFSELSVDLAKDIKEEIHKPNIDKEYVEELLTDLSQNQEKINHHGKRASSIVKGMLEHSRASTGVKEMTDINALADEYFRLSYHGLRAKDKDFNATMETDFDKNLPKINIIPQDMGRVLLNLFNNAFYAVTEKNKLNTEGVSFKPTVSLSTQIIDNQIVIKVKDNGSGMPESVRAKVFQPFFTTKPTGSGTGLGLSLAYDIVTKGHGGALEVVSNEGGGSEFIIQLSILN
jgi:two-component system, NtrC family, sensor kinase